MKIRALENQVSNLLADNLALRAETIQLRTELDDSRSKEVIRNVVAVQKQLEAKLREFTGLVSDLGDVQKKARRRKSQQPQSQRFSESKNWRSRRATLGELVAVQEGQLPTIVEGKDFPRKTLECVHSIVVIAHAWR